VVGFHLGVYFLVFENEEYARKRFALQNGWNVNYATDTLSFFLGLFFSSSFSAIN